MAARDSRGRFLKSGGAGGFMAGATGVTLGVRLNVREFDRAMASIAKYDLKHPTNARRLKRVFLEGAKLLVKPMRREAPRGPTGNLRRSIAARNPRLRPGEMAVASVGPRGGRGKGAHRWFVVEGTKPHSLAPVRKGPWVVIPIGNAVAIGPRMGNVYAGRSVRHPGQSGNDFVDRVVGRYGEQVQSFIADRIVGSGVGRY